MTTKNASTPDFFRTYRSSSPEWSPLGADDPDGSGANTQFRFAGAPDDGLGGRLDDFVTWVDSRFRPVRTETSDPVFGELQVTEFSSWGTRFEIEAPGG